VYRHQEQIKGKQKKQDTSHNIEIQYQQNIPVVNQEDIQRKVIEQAKNLISFGLTFFLCNVNPLSIAEDIFL
jgi:hypothetical protein